MEYPEDLVVKDLNSYIKSLSTEIISIIWPDVKFSGFGQNHPIHWGNDTFAYEEDDEAKEKPLLDLSSDEVDQHKAGMYAIFKMMRIEESLAN